MHLIPLFDLGNVVVRFNFAPFTRWLAERSESGDHAAAEAMVRSPLFVDFELGKVSREEFRARLAAQYGTRFSAAELAEQFCGIFPGPVEGMPELLAELAARGPVYALSNTNELHLEWLRARHPELMGPFTRVFASHELRRRKPDPAIYRDVTEALGVPASRVVFFDDLPENVHAAHAHGMQAHVFTETRGARELLKKIPGLGDTKPHGGV